MKVYNFAAIFLVVNAELDPLKTTPSSTNFDSLSLEMAEEFINKMEGGKDKDDLISVAIKSRRMDLIQLFAMNQRTCFKLVEALKEVVDENLQDEIAVMILKSESPYWNPDSGQQVGGLASRNVLSEPFITTIKRNLPDQSLKNELVAIRSARMKLAGNLEVAIGRRSGTIAPPTMERSGKRTVPRGNPTASNENVKSPSQISSNRILHETISSQKSIFARLITWVVAILAALGMSWFVIRKLKS